MEKDAFAGALNPGRPDYKYTNREGGCSKISEEFDNFHLPFEGEVEWEEPHELIKEGINLIESIKGSKYKLDSEQLVDPKTVVSFPAVEANASHLPGTEEDAIKVDVRHWTNAVDEIIRASEPQLPKMVSWWLSEASGSVAAVYKADTVTATQIAVDSILKAVRIAMTTHSRPSSAASYRKRSPIRKTTSRGSPSAAGRYVSRFMDNLRKWAKREPMEPPKRGRGQSSKFPSVGDNPNCAGIRKNARQATPLNAGNLHLLKQGFGYILQHRIRCVELTDSMGSVFLEALGLKIDEFTTSPELFRQALKSGPIGAGKLRVTAIEQHQREHIIAARVAFRDRARRGVPDDIVPEGSQLPTAEYYRKLKYTDNEIPQMEELMYGVWLSPKRKKRSVSREE
ncbi:hypothetical protein GCG54_00005619 [Colletotrichum gloeosporioides]|uniref:Uncharacterized protein n=1 Tax=Colletotrichum gloeosporioides TaxID=474922 RepID=A0A8H4FKL8_COLGL|nr:uncharacterized protein GCG54_00005619 [Colletotrichum gloeosporioides]KAF3805580.1 hypothetical protein GCG54_00005619 [Colletotrichum gloeosporioides]